MSPYDVDSHASWLRVARPPAPHRGSYSSSPVASGRLLPSSRSLVGTRIPALVAIGPDDAVGFMARLREPSLEVLEGCASGCFWEGLLLRSLASSDWAWSAWVRRADRHKRSACRVSGNGHKRKKLNKQPGGVMLSAQEALWSLILPAIPLPFPIARACSPGPRVQLGIGY